MNPPIIGLMTLPCTIRHITYGQADIYGDRASTVTETCALCELQQANTTELRDGVLMTVTTWRLFGFADPVTRGLLDVPLEAEDQVIIDCIVYAVDGKPWRVRDPLNGVTHHIEARLRIVETEG